MLADISEGPDSVLRTHMEFYKLSPDHHMDTVVQIHTPMLYTHVNKYI